jgi:hypothetical protein
MRTLLRSVAGTIISPGRCRMIRTRSQPRHAPGPGDRGPLMEPSAFTCPADPRWIDNDLRWPSFAGLTLQVPFYAPGRIGGSPRCPRCRPAVRSPHVRTRQPGRLGAALGSGLRAWEQSRGAGTAAALVRGAPGTQCRGPRPGGRRAGIERDNPHRTVPACALTLVGFASVTASLGAAEGWPDGPGRQGFRHGRGRRGWAVGCVWAMALSCG